MLRMRGRTIPIAVLSMISVGCGRTTSSGSGSSGTGRSGTNFGNVAGASGRGAAVGGAGARTPGIPIPGVSTGQNSDSDNLLRPAAGLPDGPFNSDLAIDLAHMQPEIADDSVVVQLRSSIARGDADQSGNSADWTITLFDLSTSESFEAHVLAGRGILVLTGPLLPDCMENPPAGPPAPSRVVLADAEERWGPLDPDPGTAKDRFYYQSAECAGSDLGWTVMVYDSVPDSWDRDTFLLDYTWEGEFVDMCGPCPNADCCDGW